VNFDQLKAKLDEAGIKCSQRGAEGSAFVLDLGSDRRELRIRIGEASIKVHPCLENRQAVITVAEENRQFDQAINETIRRDDLKGKKNISVSIRRSFTDKGIARELARLGVDATIFDSIGINVHSPDTKKFSGMIHRNEGKLEFSGMFSYNMANSKTSFLVGYDESRLFVSQLPRVTNSVASAHKMLKPSGLAEGWKRQGEWFFSPITEKEAEKVVARSTQYDIYSEDFLGNTDHLAAIVFNLDGKQYAIGKINGGKRHKKLLLTSIHRVIRNNEIVSASNSWD